MEIDELDYGKKPYNTNGVYDIHSLSSDGFTQYINADSFTHKFLEKNPPSLNKIRQPIDESILYSTLKPNFYTLNKISNKVEANSLEKNNINEISSENFPPQEKINEDDVLKNRDCQKIVNNEQNEDYMKNTLDINTQAKTMDNFYNSNSKGNNFHNFERNNSYENKNNTSNNKKILLKSKNLFINNKSNPKNTFNKLTANFINSDHSYGYNNPYQSTKFFSKVPSEKNFSISTNKSFYFQKSNLDPLSRRLNITSSNFSKTVNKDSNTNSRFDQNYLKNLNLFISSKSYFNMDKIIETDTISKKRYDGFESFKIPHVDTVNKSNLANNKDKKPVSLLTEKIARSCIGNRFSMNLTLTPENFNEVQDENEKLRRIMMTQTSSEFLKKTKLPEIQYCVSQPKLKIKKNNLIGGKIKHIGGKYNPYNFQAGRDCETNRRNQFGALFQH